MDNRITKRRLSDFLAYEWILTLVFVAVAVVVLELVYSIAATRLSTGQQFKYYYDQNIFTHTEGGSLYDLLGVNYGENGKTFSYDVLSVETETLLSSYNVLTTRLSVQEGDAVFTSSNVDSDEKVRAKSIIDGEAPVYRMDKLLSDAEDYLARFLTDGETDVYNADGYDEDKIRAYFDMRMKNDNRFRTEQSKEKGRQDEIGRITKLAAEVKDFKKLMDTGEAKGLFYRYTRYEQATETDTSREEAFKNAYQREKDEGRENAVYGFNLAALTAPAAAGKRDVSAYFKLSVQDAAGNIRTDASDVVLLVFDFLSYQPDLQFETISFINTIVREFSDFLD